MHTHTTPRPISPDPKARLIAELSHEWFTADPVRREEIGEIVNGVIEGKVAILTKCVEVQ